MAREYTGSSCPICLDTLKKPAALTCGHVFCSQCITCYATTTRITRCPSCRARFSGEPIQLFFSPHDEALEESGPRPKTWAEATIPTPLFAEFHLKNLREDLSAAQVRYEAAQRQLESALVEKRSLYTQNTRLIAERDDVVRERDKLLREKRIYLGDNEALVAARRELESTVEDLRNEASDFCEELTRASATIDKLELEKRARESMNKVSADEIGPTAPTTLPAASERININTSTALPSNAGGSAIALARDPPCLPASMSLDEILAGGLRKYIPSRSRSVYHP